MRLVRYAALVAALAVVTTSAAQAQGGGGGGGGGRAGGGGGGGRGGNPTAQIDALLMGITVTPAVRAKIDTIFTKAATDAAASRAGGGDATAMATINDKRNADVKALLSAADQKTFDTNVAAMAARGGRGGAGGGAPGGGGGGGRRGGGGAP